MVVMVMVAVVVVIMVLVVVMGVVVVVVGEEVVVVDKEALTHSARRFGRIWRAKCDGVLYPRHCSTMRRRRHQAHTERNNKAIFWAGRMTCGWEYEPWLQEM